MSKSLDNSGFFGRFLAQQPGWWTAIEASILLFAVIYNVSLLYNRQPLAKKIG